MKSSQIFRVSFYIMLTVATVILCGNATDSRLDGILPFIVAAAGIVAFITVDQKPAWGLPREIANLLAVGSLGILFIEYRADENQLIHSLGHWVVYLQVIKYFLPKTEEDDWFLFLLGLTQVLIGSVINQADTVGVWLFLWAMLAVWVLGLFFLQREANRFKTPSVPAAEPVKHRPADPYHGLFDMPFLLASLRVLALTLLLGGFFFLLLPRQAGATRSRTTGAMAKHLTGFDEEVRLGQLGEILENDSVVMTVEFTDEDRKPAHPEGEPLWRGVTLTQYEKGRWKRQAQRSLQMIMTPRTIRNHGVRHTRTIRQIIKLEPNDSATLFALRPVLDWTAGPRLAPNMNPLDGTLIRPDTRGGYDYEVVSNLDAEEPQENEVVPSQDREKVLLGISEGLKARFRELAQPIVKDIAFGGTDGRTARARALEGYLRDSGTFGYTLEMNVADPRLDPVEDFLINRKRGHCEYFASALALLLRSIDIPCRLVNGFKGGDWNEITQLMNVRQKHAHSWVEAYLGQTEQGVPLWITLDPTPGDDRDESVAQVGGITGSIRPVADLFRYIWVFYVLGYDSSRQNRLLYRPIAMTIRTVREGYSTIWVWLRNSVALLFDFKTIGSFISVRGFVVTFILGTLVVLAGKLAAWLFRKLMSWWRGPQDDSAGLTAGILFYRRLAQLLSKYELTRSPAETQNEFALRASRFLSGQGAPIQAVSSVPQKVVEAFYHVRFGHRDLAPESLRELEEDLDLLQNRLNDPSRAPEK